ncbi:DUF982 domain-containing protein [Brucella intermedia]|uniref:DUF982 domain-containing protein n=1 Tax=Brucella intermedia TaxID=94625 RepID=UPI00165D15FD|nr:DUF982 domain-containing protein [Brucella intermedia]MBM7323152.1 DUF982 domain-containing protein [Agrobacterium sp. S2]QNQ40952.1 DUF982 domain-containing protein [Brucella intermedia]
MPWGKPVDVQLYGIGKYRVVPDTATAARCLLDDWPEDAHGKEYEEALQACLADLEGLPNTARKSFIKAAKAAGLTMRPSQWN